MSTDLGLEIAAGIGHLERKIDQLLIRPPSTTTPSSPIAAGVANSILHQPCEAHLTERATYYCMTCNQLACDRCAPITHTASKNCNVVLVNAALIEKKRDEVKSMMENGLMDRNGIKTSLEELELIHLADEEAIKEVFGEKKSSLRSAMAAIELELKEIEQQEASLLESEGKRKSDLKSLVEAELTACEEGIKAAEALLHSPPSSTVVCEASSLKLKTALAGRATGVAKAVKAGLMESLAHIEHGQLKQNDKVQEKEKKETQAQYQARQQQPKRHVSLKHHLSCAVRSHRLRVLPSAPLPPIDPSHLHPSKIIGGSNDAEMLKGPCELCVAGDLLYVADTDNHRISVFGMDGSYIRSIGSVGSGNGQLSCPQGVSVSENFVYVADSNNHRVSVFHLNGDFDRHFGVKGTQPGQLNCPVRVSVTKDRVYVANRSNHRIEVFDLAGRFVRSIGGLGVQNGKLQSPQGVCVVADLLYVADTINNRVSVFGVDGSFKQCISHKGKNGDGGGISTPVSVHLWRDLIYVAEWNGNCVSVFLLDGSFVCDIGRNVLKQPECAVLADGQLFVSEKDNNFIQVFE